MILNGNANIFMQDGDINEGSLLLDGLHLYRALSNILVDNIKLLRRHCENSTLCCCSKLTILSVDASAVVNESCAPIT